MRSNNPVNGTSGGGLTPSAGITALTGRIPPGKKGTDEMTDSDGQMTELLRRYPVQLNSYCKALSGRSSAVAKLYLPDLRELENPGLEADGLAELEQSPVPNLIRRYRDRAVLLTTSECFVRCRFCFRKRLWADGAARFSLSDENLDQVCEWLDRNREVDDILLSGGDPLVLNDDRVVHLATRIRAAGNVRTVRICSRAPAVEPRRITEQLTERLSVIDGLWFVTHFNHPDELTPESEAALKRLVSHGIPVLNQSVLLKGVNDDAETLRRLFKGLSALRVKPHYLFHIDPVEGVSHFATGVEKGLAILEDFRYTLSSLATPAFAIDLPRGAGKVVLVPDCAGKNGYRSSVTGEYVDHPLARTGGGQRR